MSKFLLDRLSMLMQTVVLASEGWRSSSRLKEKVLNPYRYDSCSCKRSVNLPIEKISKSRSIVSVNVFCLPAGDNSLLANITPPASLIQLVNGQLCRPVWVLLCIITPNCHGALSIHRFSSTLQKYISLCFTEGRKGIQSAVTHLKLASGKLRTRKQFSLILV